MLIPKQYESSRYKKTQNNKNNNNNKDKTINKLLGTPLLKNSNFTLTIL